MGIQISESTALLQVPYGPFTNEGTPDAGFVDLKANPDWIAVMPACLGWPETRDLLRTINSWRSSFMTLAADQAFTATSQPEFSMVLTSFVTLCYADVERNMKQAVADLAECLKEQMADFLQGASNELQQTLFLNVLLELQPTIFHHEGVDGWSVTVFMAAYGHDEREARRTWCIGVNALQEALTQRDTIV